MHRHRAMDRQRTIDRQGAIGSQPQRCQMGSIQIAISRELYQ
ncbi:hypothetical protein QT971_11390 [Microcoleus sp. herbarium19]